MIHDKLYIQLQVCGVERVDIKGFVVILVSLKDIGNIRRGQMLELLILSLTYISIEI